MSIVINGETGVATLTVEFSGQEEVAGGVVTKGLLWSPKNSRGLGDESWISSMVSNFNSPVPFNVQHTKTVFDTSLGNLDKVWEGVDANGDKALFGQWVEPAWVGAALGKAPRPVSIEVNLEKKSLHAVSLVYNPSVEQAMLSAFAKFSADDIDKKDDVQYHNSDGSDKGNKRNMLESVKDFIKSFSEAPKEDREALARALVVEPDEPQETERERTLRVALEQEKTRSAQFAKSQIDTQAESWVKEQVAAGKLTPAEADKYKATYSELSLADAGTEGKASVIKFSVEENGATVEKQFNRVDVLKELFAKIPAKQTTSDVTAHLQFNKQKTDGATVESFSEIEKQAQEWVKSTQSKKG